MIWCFLFACLQLLAQPKIQLGVDRVFEEGYIAELKGMKIGLITNHTGVSGQLKLTFDLFQEHAKEYKLVSLFCPEHGLDGTSHADEKVKNSFHQNIRVYSLHGETKRPTAEMLEGIDVLIYDIQEIGCRSYTYASTLYYAMEEAAKKGIDVVVLDRPNPINGVMVDGPMLEEINRSFLGYVNVPYCHGMTIGELARYFNEEYLIGCNLRVVPMKGWKREMTFQETGLTWIPTSPQIPESDSPLFYPMTGLLGELEVVNIGIGYTLPFKVVGAPWIDAKQLAEVLNQQKLPGVIFLPFHYKPFFGRYKQEECHGVKIVVSDSKSYRPVSVDYLIIGVLKTLYPKVIKQKLSELSFAKREMFKKLNGTDRILKILETERYVGWKLIEVDEAERKMFLEKRKRHLLY